MALSILPKSVREERIFMVNMHDKITKRIKLLIVFLIGVVIVLLVLNSLPKQSNNQSGSILFQSAVGSIAPNFSLQALNGTTVTLSNYRGKNVVLFFSMGAECLACLNQIVALANDSRFGTNNTVVFSIVVSQKSSWAGPLQQMPALKSANILFDTNGTVSKAYDVLNLPSSMDPGVLPGHTFFLINKSGIIRWTLDDPTMSIDNNKVLAAISRINSSAS